MTSSTTDEAGPLGCTAARAALQYFELKPGKVVSTTTLKTMLPDVKTALFFAKAYKLDASQLSTLLSILFNSSLLDTLINEGHAHSTSLQDYLIEVAPPAAQHYVQNPVHFDDTEPVPTSELLADIWEQVGIEVAASIAEVAEKLAGVLDRLPSKYGEMTFAHLRKLNLQRNSIGKFGPQIQHNTVESRLVILDVSGSMTENTIRKIVDEVVALAYQANASLAIVSDTTTWWDAGTFSTHDVLKAAEYSGTHYETLKEVLDEDWETVITIADYDSAASALRHIGQYAQGRIGQVLDISLVPRPTYLAEVVGQLAKDVKPLLIGQSHYMV
jgi:hypothetical protein